MHDEGELHSQGEKIVLAAEQRPAEAPKNDGDSSNSQTPRAASVQSMHASDLAVSEAPPDRGLQAWLQVLAGHLVNALTWGNPNRGG